MSALYNFIANKSGIFKRSPDLLLVSTTLMPKTESSSPAFRIIASAGEGTSPLKYEELHDFSNVRVFQQIAVIVGADFDAWGELQNLIQNVKFKGTMTVLMLVPTNDDPIAQASLAQFITELEIRLQAYGFLAETRLAARCSTDDLSPITLRHTVYGTLLGRFLNTLIPEIPGYVAIVASRVEPPQFAIPHHAPLFTVLTRTQGTRMETLREVLLCLSAQTIDDFEHLIIAHNAKPEAIEELNAMIADQSEWSRARTRLEAVRGGTRTTPLNAGFAIAKGKYIIILDDDDIVFANWLETFRAIARDHPGALLRTVAVRQEFTWAYVEGKRSARATSAMHRDYAPTFDYLDHLEVNQTPPVSIAFPRFLFARHGMHFDESLTTAEDWDYIMRCAARVGVGSSEEITCIYRWWVGAESSRTIHTKQDWAENHKVIQEKINGDVNLIGEGFANKFLKIHSKVNEYLRWANKLHTDISEIQIATNTKNPDEAREKIVALSQVLQAKISEILQGTSIKMCLPSPHNDLLPSPRFLILYKFFCRSKIAHFRMRKRRETIIESGIFDPEWYTSFYADLTEQKLDPLDHFITYGSRELRSPSAQFNARQYYEAHVDLQEHKIEPVFHFVLHGKREGRRFESHT